MHLQNRLASCGMSGVFESLEIRAKRLQAAGISCTPEDLLTPQEVIDLKRVEGQIRAVSGAGVKDRSDLFEFDRLVALLARETGEPRSWLSRLSLQRLRQMMDALEN
ncbi:hypothetical protein [Pseudomonas aeruginosa]|uniref:hypothetical protein n=1 Tax=Pseudomonas aeruginosa TaxID=287 RepID=UPI001046A70A|nr:hypothetical protein [Pseudomonas aeruginosa]